MPGTLTRLRGLAAALAHGGCRAASACSPEAAVQEDGRVSARSDGHYSFSTIEAGDDVFLGPGAFLSASESFIHIGSKVLFGPNVTVLGGDHRLDVVGMLSLNVARKNQTTIAE